MLLLGLYGQSTLGEPQKAGSGHSSYAIARCLTLQLVCFLYHKREVHMSQKMTARRSSWLGSVVQSIERELHLVTKFSSLLCKIFRFCTLIVILQKMGVPRHACYLELTKVVILSLVICWHLRQVQGIRPSFSQFSWRYHPVELTELSASSAS